MLSQAPDIQSPCNSFASLIYRKAFARAARSREEIAMWTRYSDAKRAFVMTELAERLEKLEQGKVQHD